MLDLIDNEDEVEHNDNKIKEMSIKDEDAMDENDEDDMETNKNKRKHDIKVNNFLTRFLLKF